MSVRIEPKMGPAYAEVDIGGSGQVSLVVGWRNDTTRSDRISMEPEDAISLGQALIEYGRSVQAVIANQLLRDSVSR